ncbi:M64 family metallopeptidase [Streptomyces sp. NPDC048172]|uniref:M64 family metallopeptidase n=1 Tax=Streptomyces sp. NPDC048172 TaxID=3365505 RepID=UPI003723E43E
MSPHRRKFAATATVSALAAAAALLSLAPSGNAAPTDGTANQSARTHDVEHFAPSGPGGYRPDVPARAPKRITDQQRPLSAAEAKADGAVEALHRTGSTEERLDLVFVGDGYTADQQEDFHKDAEAKWGDVTAVEPYKSHTDKMNVWTVDAVSNDSGVSGDPGQDVVKDTALGSYFWCDGMERLLCADLNKVNSYAAKAPAADIVVVVSNSEKYGGAGYNRLTDYPFDGVSTLSSDNADSGLIAVHEMAHSIGRLADEYDYGQSGEYTGPEPEDVNISTYTADEMKQNGAKWHDWLGKDDPAGGQTGAFEGAGYYEKGLYRPTETSLMRDFSVREFNNPSREGLIDGFERYTQP